MIKREWNAEAKILRFVETVDGAILEAREFDIGALPVAIQEELFGHGCKAKLGDVFAGVSDFHEAMLRSQALYETLAQGEWTQRSTSMLLVSALVDVYGVTEEAALAKIQGKGKAWIDEQKKVPAIAAWFAQDAANKAAKKAEIAAEKAGNKALSWDEI